MTKVHAAVTAEIIAFHDFFVEWFTGRAERQTLETEMAGRLVPGFTIIPPSGDVVQRDQLLTAFGALHGTRPNIRIKVKDVVIRHHIGGHVIASYTEWQRGDDANNVRQSTVVMTDVAPFQWLGVHETWLQESAFPAGDFAF